MRLLSRPLFSTLFLAIFRYVTLISFLFNILLLCAHDDLNDLEKNLSGMQDDTVKVNLLVKLGQHYCSKENNKALMFLQEAYTLSTALNYTEGIGKSLFWQGRVYYYTDDYPLSNKYFERAEKYFQNEEFNDEHSFLCFARGENYRINGDYIRAVESYTQALELAETTGNQKYISTFYNSLGMVHLDRKDAEKAMGYFKESLNRKKGINDKAGISNILTCIGKAFEELNLYDSSLYYHYQAKKIRKELNNERAIAGSEYNIAGVLIKMQLYKEAEQALLVAKENFTNFEEKTGIIITDLRIAIARSRQNLPDAITIAESALQMAIDIDNPNLISHSYKILSDIYFYNQGYQKAYDYLKKHHVIQDSIFSTEKERILAEFEEKFQSERKDRELEDYRAKNKIQNQNIILLAVLLVAAVGFVLLLFFLFRIKSTTLKRQEKLLEQEIIIHDQENKLAEKENQILQEQLEVKNRALASKALEMIRLNDTISHIIDKLETIKQTNNNNPEVYKHIKEIINELETQTKQNIWNEFNKIFKNIHSDFYSKLLNICPDLTSTEIKTAALLRLNLTSKEIAAIAFKSEGGVKTTRYRLRKKLNLGSDEKLIPFLMQI